MRVDAISIPAAAQAASTVARSPSSAPRSFSATLALSVRSGAPEHHQDHSAALGTTAKSEPKLGAKSDAAAGAKFGVSLNAKSATKSSAKSDAKLAVSSATAPENQPSLPTYPLSASLLATLLTTSPTTSPTLAKTVAAPPPLSSAQPVAPTAQITSGTFPLSGLPNALSQQDQPGSKMTSAVPRAVTGRAETLPTSNFTQSLDVLPANSAAAKAPVDVPVPTAANSKSAESPSASGQAASDAAYSFPSVPTRAPTAQAKSSTSAASVLPTRAVLASPTQGSPTPVSPAATTAASTAPRSPDSQFQAPIPTGASILALDQSPILQSPILQSPILQSPPVMAAPFSPAPVMPAELLTQPAPSSLLQDSAVQPKDQTVPSPAYNPSPVAATTSAFNTLSPTSSAPAPTPIPTQQSSVRDTNLAFVTEGANSKQPAALKASDSKVGNSISPTSSAPTAAPIATLQFPVRDINPAPVTQPANAKQPAGPKSSESRVGNSKPDNSSPGNCKPGDPTAGDLAPTSSSAMLDAAPAQALSSHATTTVAAQNIASNIVSSLAANLTPSSAAPVATAASSAAAISAAPGTGKPGLSTQPARTAAPQATGPNEKSERKSSAAVPPNATASRTTPLHDFPTTLASGKDSSATLSAPAPPASAPPPQVALGAAPELPKTHQMLDSAPPVPPTPPIAPDPAAAPMNAQMHVGIRTEAFGAVEIHTVVQQSQVGITVHADRDIARWFTSELPGLESGLNKNHLNLTTVDFDNGRSGIQTATSFQHGHPQQHFSETPDSRTNALPHQNTASESAGADTLTSDLSVGPAQTHVSIHV